MAYSPTYLDSLDDVPVQIPDDFSQSDKEDAVELAESLIEVDLEDGRRLSAVTSVHKAAIKQRATCELAKGAADPDNTSIGDIQDDGTSKSEYAHTAFCDHYHELVGKIRSFMEEDTGGVLVYNTDKSDDRLEWDRFERDIDIDWDENPAGRETW